MADVNPPISIIASTVNRLNSPVKDRDCQTGLKKKRFNSVLCERIEKNIYVLISTPGFWHRSLGNPCNFLSHKWKKPVTIYTTNHILYDICYHFYEVPRVAYL